MTTRAFLIALALCSASQAGTMDPSVPESKYVDYGEKHECVVPIYGDCDCEVAGGGKTHRFSGSAVVVAPRWIVTAAHIVDEAHGVKVKAKGREYTIGRIIVNKNFKKENVGMYDIAVCMSDDEIELGSYPKLYEDMDEEGKVASICGYGAYGTFSSGATRYDGRKRAGANIVGRTEMHVLVCNAGRTRKTAMDFVIAHGDSGGGLFIDGRVAGINSFVSATDGKPDSSYGDECNHTRISLFAPWIKAHMNGEEPREDVE